MRRPATLVPPSLAVLAVLAFGRPAGAQVFDSTCPGMDNDRPAAPAGGSYAGPGDTTGPTGGSRGGTTAPVGGGSSSPAGGARGSAGGGATPATSGGGPGPSPAPTTVNLTTTSDDGWWLWWEHAKSEFLAPNRLTLESAPTTGEDAAGVLRDAIERVRREIAPALTAASADPDANQRATAAIALARTAGAGAVERLLVLLDDPSQVVRHAALIGLGLTGSPRGAMELLHVARFGAARGDATTTVSPYARPIAVIALALARRAGLEEPMDVAVVALLREAQGADRDAIALAAMLHHALVPSAALETAAVELALDERATPSTRCRAVEVLASTHDPKVVRTLEKLLVGPRLDLRRSAALALGRTGDPDAWRPLKAAFEGEAEPLTRGLMLVSLGRLGGGPARSLLLAQLDHGERGMRRWAALALGILGRDRGDGEVAAAVRAAGQAEKNQDARAAYWLASGLLRDAGAVPLLASGLNTAANPLQRMYAATALALVGGEPAAVALRARLDEERSDVVRVALAQGLGLLGAPADVARIRGVLAGLTDPSLQALASTALAYHGTPEALDALRELSASGQGSRVQRAASIEGLGFVLTRGEPLLMGEFARRTNYTVLPDWVRALLATTV